LEEAFYNGIALPIAPLPDVVTEHEQICNHKWKELYSKEAHFKLQNAIINQLLKNENEYKSNK
jgi:hypothetical protein